MAQQKTWHLADFRQVQTEIREELRAEFGDSRPAERLAEIRRQLAQLDSAATTPEMMRRYVFAMSALAHHQRFGGLKRREVLQLRDLALVILRVSGISQRSATLAFLYADVHMVTSQVLRAAGDHFLSGWEQNQSERYIGRIADAGQGARTLGNALRRTRLGILTGTLPQLVLAENSVDQARDFVICRSVRLKSMRLLRQHEDFDQLLNATLREHADNEALCAEASWENACRNTQRDQTLTPIVSLCKRNRPHYRACYMMEGKLYAAALQSTRWLSTLPKVQSMIRNESLDPRSDPALMNAAQTIESCYDNVIPFEIRLTKLGECLDQARILAAIDQELLLWLAATRWLVRSHAFAHAAQAMVEYEKISLIISHGSNQDALGLASDLFAATWYQQWVLGRGFGEVEQTAETESVA